MTVDDIMSDRRCADPVKFAQFMWPHVYFYKQQREVLYSVMDNDQTFVPAGNMLGH